MIKCSVFFTQILSVYLVAVLALILLLFQVQVLTIVYPSNTQSTSWGLFQHLSQSILNSNNIILNCSTDSKQLKQEPNMVDTRLKDSVTFLPLKDLRYAKTAMQGNTWFMSSLNNTYEGNESEYIYFPSTESKGRHLCVNGRDRSDGAQNSYALAWPDALPAGATMVDGLTYVSDTYYDYHNIWHALSAMMPMVGWYQRKGCTVPARWVLFHWGELRVRMGPWVRTLMEATFGRDGVNIETFDGSDGSDTGPVCYDEAVVFRHNLGRMSRERRVEVFDMLRCVGRYLYYYAQI